MKVKSVNSLIDYKKNDKTLLNGLWSSKKENKKEKITKKNVVETLLITL